VAVVKFTKMKKRVNILRYTPARGDIGEETGTWNTLSTVWAGVESVKGKDRYLSEETMLQEVVRFILRVTDLAGDDKIEYNNQRYSISSISKDDRYMEVIGYVDN